MLLDLLPLFEEEAGGFTRRRELPDLFGYAQVYSSFCLSSQVEGYAEVYGEVFSSFSLVSACDGHTDKAFHERRDVEALIALGVL